MIAATELALIQVLLDAGEEGVLGYQYHTFGTFPDQFEEYLRTTKNLRVPGVWATFLGIVEGDDDLDDNGFRARSRFALVVAAENLRNEENARHGDGAVPGSYQLMVDAIRLLSRSTLTPELDLVEPVRIRSARPVARTEQMKRQNLSMMAIELELVLPLSVFAEEPVDLRTLHVDWDIPAFGGVAPPLPAANPDAADQIELGDPA
ncbi:phage protein Gp37 [Erythrobacter colymbi]|uniref:phage protein Gp37 n=1 Tax=Erythrobacter colymbi TaxID=1161202 RepID=UPI00138FC9FF|nr:phage protein Gp37 [Erythrobacter colymbi]